MHVIVGLGNPGEKYARSRHNLGRLVLEMLLKAHDTVPEERRKHAAHVGTLMCGGKKVTVLLPNTFMNKSGSAVRTIVTNASQAAKLVVVYDDIDMPWGMVRVSWNRSSGGHNGVESVIKAVKTKEFIRIRIGVAPTTPTGKLRKPKGEQAVVDFLMGDLGKKEQAEMPNIVKRVEKALALIVTEGKEVAMNEINSV